jgi:hypothetical protein
MAKVTLVIDFPEVTKADLQLMVSKADEEMSGDGQGIDPRYVDALDILGMFYTDALEGLRSAVLQDIVED